MIEMEWCIPSALQPRGYFVDYVIQNNEEMTLDVVKECNRKRLHSFQHHKRNNGLI